MGKTLQGLKDNVTDNWKRFALHTNKSFYGHVWHIHIPSTVFEMDNLNKAFWSMCSGVWGCKYLFVLKDLSPHLMFYFSLSAHCVLSSFTTVFISLQLFKTWDLFLFSQWKKTRKLDLQVSCARPHIDMLLLITSHPLMVRIFIQILKVNSPVMWFSSIWCKT